MHRAHGRAMSELLTRMTLSRNVNDIISDGYHIDESTIPQSVTILHSYPSLMAVINESCHVFASVHSYLSTTRSVPLNDRLLIIRVILWQYCKTLPYMTEEESTDYCDLYFDLKYSVSHGVCEYVLLGGVGVLCGALLSIGVSAMLS